MSAGGTDGPPAAIALHPAPVTPISDRGLAYDELRSIDWTSK